MTTVPFTEQDLHDLYLWVDEVPISRPKRNIARDFADGCCVAEIVKFFFPKIVDLHNYMPAMSLSKKRDNWNTLNAKVFRKLYFEVPAEEIEDIVSAVPGAVERFLRALRIKISQIKAQREERLAAGWGADSYPGEVAYDGPTDAYPAMISRPSHRNGGPSMSPGAASRLMGSVGGRPSSAAARGPAIAPPTPPSWQQQQQQQQVVTRSPAAAGGGSLDSAAQSRLLEEKERTILELHETVGILSEKIIKLEELVRVKDEKLNQYRSKFGKV